jgi:NADPH:quinone reductase-like Zn-dependent oxidoreductase
MKAIIYEKYGSPDVLQLKEVEKPKPKENEVLVKVKAVSINDWDWGLLNGDSLVNRLINGLLKPKRKILGSDIAGMVEEVGKDAKRFNRGDEVFGDLSGKWGGFAEYVCASENMLAIKSNKMKFEEAAAIPQAGMLAVQGLIDKGHIKKEKKVLINGAGGGVGTIGVQIAKQYGVEITGVDNTDKLKLMRLLGFDNVIDFTKEDFTQNSRGYDLILDVKTNRSIFKYAGALKSNGIYVTVGGSTVRLLQALLFKSWIKLINKKNISIVALKQNKDLGYMTELFESGKLKPVIDGSFKLEEVPKALKMFGKGEHKGKLVITIEHKN